MNPVEHFSGLSPELAFAALLSVFALIALALLIALAFRRSAGESSPPRRLSALAGLGFWTALLAFGTLGSGFIILSLVRYGDLMGLSDADAKDLLVGATIITVTCVIPAGISVLLSLGALGSLHGHSDRRVYGFGLAILNLVICAVVLVGAYMPGISLDAHTTQYHKTLQDGEQTR